MQYNIVNIIDKSISEKQLKKIINQKLYKIITLLEFNNNTQNY